MNISGQWQWPIILGISPSTKNPNHLRNVIDTYPIEPLPCPDFKSTSISQPNLKCTQFGKYKKEYEDKIAIAEVK